MEGSGFRTGKFSEERKPGEWKAPGLRPSFPAPEEGKVLAFFLFVMIMTVHHFFNLHNTHLLT